MIEVVKAKKYYNRFRPNQVTAINNTSLSFEDNGLVAILGNSGCGKTTLLNVIGGLDKPASGKIYVNGKKMNSIFSSKTDNIRNKNIGYIFQNYHLVDDMTVFENVALPLKMLGIRDKNKIKENVFYALEKVGLYRYRNRPVTALSGGERQRVGVARAIVKNPSIIIADEPTGNLDSGNSIEVMNIIKSISKEKLVILVTHERTLAEFYADRIIEIVDGKVTEDRVNEHDDKLDYRIENKIYLKDIEDQQHFEANGINFSYYSDGSAKLNVKLVLRNGNLYFECDGKKTEIVDSDSSIELIDDHYHPLTKEEAEKYDFDYTKLELGKKKLRYHSIYNIFTMFGSGIKKVVNYPKLKKILLLGFIASSMFILYSVSNVLGVNTITDDKFIQAHRDYLVIKNTGNTVADYFECKNLEGVKYIMPGDGRVRLYFDYSDYFYQTNESGSSFNASMAALSIFDENTLIAGRLPENEYEIIVDKLAFADVMRTGEANMVGLISTEDFIGKECKLGEYDKKFTVVGICDEVSPCVYVNDDMMLPIIIKSMYSGYLDENNNANVTPVTEAKGKLSITYGRMPTKDYEVILPTSETYNYWLGWTYPGKVNGHKLTIVGFYDSSKDTGAFCSYDTWFYKFIVGTNNITIYPEDKDAVLSYYTEKNINIVDTYEEASNEYRLNVKDSIKTSTIIAAVVMGVSLIEIFLMLRSSFLSRIKEVGTLRAIGLKKSDVYKMFLGEILVITLTTTPIGFVIMGYILKTLTTVEFFVGMYTFDWRIFAISGIIIFVFNIIIGLLPVYTTLRKTPARILARKDVD